MREAAFRGHGLQFGALRGRWNAPGLAAIAEFDKGVILVVPRRDNNWYALPGILR